MESTGTTSTNTNCEQRIKEAIRNTALRCREMAMWPQGIDDEQAYYGKMFAEFITKEFKLDET